MKTVIQRVQGARVEVSSEVVGEIEGAGILALLGFGSGDNESIVKAQMSKLVHLRIFPDEKGRFDKSLLDISGKLLLVPQFTLYADTNKGRRPEFFSAMPPKDAELLFQYACEEAIRLLAVDKVARGIFGADMKVHLMNDGPVTILLES